MAGPEQHVLSLCQNESQKVKKEKWKLVVKLLFCSGSEKKYKHFEPAHTSHR